MARSVADAATLLGAIAGVDPRDEATAASAGRSRTDYTSVLDPAGLKGARLGVLSCPVHGLQPGPPTPSWRARSTRSSGSGP